MGTLTADSNRLPEYCEHKLPTSCRLSSIPNCCACADEREHSAAYSTYIDGIGFVPRGTRWLRYCWYCKEFWEKRVQASGIRPGQTQVPDNPDQTEFLERWYEFHRGYRMVRKEDGSEEKVSVLGEDFREVSPGCLPRTLEELRVGRHRAEEVRQGQAQARAQVRREPETDRPSLEDTLDQLFIAASTEASDQQAPRTSLTETDVHWRRQPVQEVIQSTNVHVQAMHPPPSRNREYQMRRVAALRRELNRMRNGIERVINGLRDLGENVPNYSETTGRLTTLGQTLDTISDNPSRGDAERAINNINAVMPSTTVDGTSQSDRTFANMQSRVDEARTQMDEARRARDQAANELDLAEQEFRTSQHRFHQLQREQRTTENYMRIFGTREEVLAQGESYVSPIGSMFTRATERFTQAEEVRREQRTLRQVLEDEARGGGEDEARRLAELETRGRDVWGVPQPHEVQRSMSQMGIPPAALEPGALGSQFDGATNESLGRSTGPTPGAQSETPPVVVSTRGENILNEYYAIIESQDRDRLSSTNEHVPPSERGQEAIGLEQRANLPRNDNFPQSMLNAIHRAREREVAQQTSSQTTVSDDGQQVDEGVPTHNINENPPLQFSRDEWWNQDATHIINSVITNQELRNELGISPLEASILSSYFVQDIVSEADRNTIDGLLRNTRVIWGTCLPVEWLRRRREQVPEAIAPQDLFFTSDEGVPGSQDWAEHHNPLMGTEMVAQAFQMSSDIRRLASELPPPERLQMLYRLQRSERNRTDISILERLRDDDTSFGLACSRYSRVLSFDGARRESVQTRLVDESRQTNARDGDHSRQALDARRRDTTSALAASRIAMQTGSQALLARMTDRSEGAQAAYQRLQANNYLGRPPRPNLYRQLTLSDYLNSADTESDSESEKEEELETRGLDARHTGRPEAKTDQELKVQMECKICYTQLAEVACLPCGHLVMCRWCSEQHSPCLQHDATRPRRAAACPVCRKSIRQKVRVFRA